MKLRNLLLTAALFISASAAFAIEASTHTHFTTMPRTPGMKNLSITVFRMNGETDDGWSYTVYGYTKDANGNIINSATTTLATFDGKTTPWVRDDELIDQAIASIEGLPADIRTGLMNNAVNYYKLTIAVPDTIDELGFKGGAGGGNTTTSISDNPATNGNHFFSYGDGNVIYFGKNQFIPGYNNGAVIVAETVGSPLPAPVVTLLIALVFGSALVMYRNRKQVKA